MTKYEQITKLVEFALNEVGYKETPKNITKYSAYFEGSDFYNGSKGDGKTWGAEWCDIFVDYCFCNVFGMEQGRQMLCQPKKSCGAGCKYSANYYKNAKRFFTAPEVGDQIFFIVGGDINHTGIVTKVTGDKVFTVEGNSSDQVKTHSYALTNKKIAGYGRPKWSEDTATIPVVTEPAKPVETSKPIEQKPSEPVKPVETPKQETFMGTVSTVKDPLRVRASASLKAPVLRMLKKGTKVEVFKTEQNGFYKLATMPGYVWAKYIK